VDQAKDIKTMKLYHSPDRIFNELKALGIADDAPLSVEQLVPFDQYHYLGTDAVDEAIDSLSLVSQSRVLEVGSGIGGPARYLAHRTNCQVSAVELQTDLHEVAASLTKRCGLEDRVRHYCENILDFSTDPADFDGVVSWLSFLHIPDRSTLLNKCHDLLRHGGKILIEDFYKRGELSPEETRILSEDIFCDYLPSLEEYRSQLLESRFIEVRIIDKTRLWADFVNIRLRQFVENRRRHLQVHGPEIVEALEIFYQRVSQLYAGGHLGGAQLIAEKP